MLDLAARVALRGLGAVEPNPLVGAAIVQRGHVIGLAHHRRFGQPHAERLALDDARARGHDLAGATCYTTLEPCAHTGRNPPCTRALIDARIARVVFAAHDPNPLAAGGAAALRAAGIQADHCPDSAAAVAVSHSFRKRTLTQGPWVIAKWAQTIDGRIATRSGQSRWISCDAARARVHRLRARVDAILCGLGTVLADDPSLTARDVPRVHRVAARVVADASLDIPLAAQLVRTARVTPTVVACNADVAASHHAAAKRAQLEAAGVRVLPVPHQRDSGDPSPDTGTHRADFARPGGSTVDLRSLLGLLWSQLGIATVLVESGTGLLGALVEHDLIDEAIVHVAPLLLGDELAKSVATGRVAEALASGRKFELLRVHRVGSDVELLLRRPDRHKGQAHVAGTSASARA